jgi:hypothetical protein
MKRFLMSTAALALLTAPAFAQSSVTTTQTTRTTNSSIATEPAPVPPPAPPASYESRTVTHSDNGYERKDSASQERVGPDGSTSTRTKVIEQTNQ